ncbi:saccharopine dehydrogenase family protein [Halomonas sp. H5]|uniref:saccharopine dehydrogenase family protein n=1 Tax=Halomonas sp. H5 TaxID=3423910 RepID=UPI003D36517B
MRILLLGCGGVGSNVARLLVPRHPTVEFIIADRYLEVAESLVGELGGRPRALALDVQDPEQLDAALAGVDLVFNSVGPFYQHALGVIEAAIRAGVDYLDINDDHDVAERLFLDPDIDLRAREAGVQLVIGCGSTPGLTNVITRYLAERMDRPRSVSLATAVPFSPALFSPAVLDHMFHITSGEVVQFIDGAYRKVPGWGGRREIDFDAPFGRCAMFHIGHGEAVTIPHFIKGLEEVQVRLGFIPEAASTLWRTLVDFGFDQTAPVAGAGLSPQQFLGHYLASEAGASRLQVPLDDAPWGAAFRVEVSGQRGHDEVFSALEFHHMLPTEESAEAEFMADPTPICAWLAVQAWIEGRIHGEGLLAPEACLEPEPYLRAFAEASGARFVLREHRVTPDLYGAATTPAVAGEPQPA